MDPQNVAFIFPGQGSQAVGMGHQLTETYRLTSELYAEADAALGYPLSALSWNGPEEQLNETVHTQPALLVHSVAAWTVLQDTHPDWQPRFTAGHSMGQLSALVAAGALPFREALFLVRRRGELMKAAGEIHPGGMAAILGLDIPTLDELCQRASAPDEVVQVANDNCPGQVVISGAKPALERALEMARQAGARRALPLAVSIAAHSPLMAHAQADFNQAVLAAPIQAPVIPIIGNVTASPLTTAEQIRQELQAQLTSRVRWTESIEYMIAAGVQAFVEIGSGTVLSGLVKRIAKEATCFNVATPEDIERLGKV